MNKLLVLFFLVLLSLSIFAFSYGMPSIPTEVDLYEQYPIGAPMPLSETFPRPIGVQIICEPNSSFEEGCSHSVSWGYQIGTPEDFLRYLGLSVGKKVTKKAHESKIFGPYTSSDFENVSTITPAYKILTMSQKYKVEKNRYLVYSNGRMSKQETLEVFYVFKWYEVIRLTTIRK